MTGEPPRPDEGEPGGVPLRWQRDSAAEDIAARKVTDTSRLSRWNPETGEVDPERWGTWIVPAGWAGTPPPEPRCGWCQRPGDTRGEPMCERCRAAQAQAPDPPPLLDWWAGLDPLARRLHLAAAHRADPWTGEPFTLIYEAAEADAAEAEAGVRVSRSPASSAVPRTSWDLPAGLPLVLIGFGPLHLGDRPVQLRWPGCSRQAPYARPLWCACCSILLRTGRPAT